MSVGEEVAGKRNNPILENSDCEGRAGDRKLLIVLYSVDYGPICLAPLVGP